MMNRWRRFVHRLDPYLILLLVLVGFVLAPLFADGYFYSAHDGRHSVFFVAMFDEAIRDGALWPRWAMHHSQGYGYPTFVIQAPLAFYVAEIFILLGAGITVAVKWTWAVAAFASAWGMYALVRAWTEGEGEEAKKRRSEEARDQIRNSQALRAPAIRNSSLAALLAALLYVFIPYRLVDMYVRAALAETMLMAWFPWVFLAFERLLVRGMAPGWAGRLLVAALTLAALLLTHVIAILAFPPLLGIFILFRLWTLRRTPNDGSRWPLKRLVLAATAGMAALLMAAIFIAPLLAEGPLLNQETFVQDTYSYERHWVYWGQFFSPFWGYGYSDDPTGANDGMGFQVGLLPWLLLIAAISMLFGKDGEGRSARLLLLFLLLVTLGILFVMTPAAAPLWAALSPLSVIQFPWRLLALSSFTISALGGLVIWRLLQRSQTEEMATGGALVMGVLVVFASLGYARPQALQPVEAWREDGRAVFQFESEHPDMYGYTRQVEETFSASPMTPQYQDPEFSTEKLERLAILRGEGQILSHYSRGHSSGGEVDLATAATVQIRVYDHPGWQVRVDGQSVVHRVSPPYGLIEVDLPTGRHRIDLRMGSTPVRTASAAVSALTLILLAGLWAWKR
jgi:hypothetical protein